MQDYSFVAAEGARAENARGANAPTFAPASLRCRDALPSTVLASSRAAGWTSVLVEHHRVRPTEEPFETRATSDQTLVVMTRGEQALESFNGGVWRRAVYRAGTIGMTPGGKTDRLRRRVGRTTAPFEKLNLYVPPHFFREAAEHYRRAGRRYDDAPPSVLAFHDALVAETVVALARAMAAGAPDLYAQAAAQWLAAHLLAAHGAGPHVDESRRDPGVISDRRLARVVEYMSAHVAEPLTLDRLAAEAGVSKFHFARLFRARTGAPPHAFLVELRVGAARRLLATTDLDVAEVAAACGFARPTHFATAFARRAGVSPTAFRRRARG
ncbi:AraC family transcriptional regulator [Gemmatimonadetes bacterium T265]|nr:AraC family transcriptional regulator [Gemmatimonadetes bacterium T265]